MRRFIKFSFTAQFKNYSKKIEKKVNTKDLVDTFHSNIASAEKCVQNYDVATAKTKFLKAIQISRDLKNTEYEFQATMALGNCHFNIKEYQKSYDVISRLYDKVKKSNNAEWSKKYYKIQASNLKLLGKYKESQVLFEEALKLPLEENEKLFLLEKLGEMMILNNDLEKSPRVFEEILEIQRDSPDYYSKAMVLLNLSLVLFRGNKIEESEKKAQDAKNIAIYFGDTSLDLEIEQFKKRNLLTEEKKEFFQYFDRAKTINSYRDYSASEYLYNKCIDLCNSHTSLKNFKTVVLCDYGKILTIQHQFEKAEKLLLEAKGIALKEEEHLVSYQLGYLYFIQKNFKKSLEQYESALKSDHITENQKIENLSGIAILYSIKGEFEKADEYFNLAYEQSVKNNIVFKIHYLALNEVLKGEFKNASKILEDFSQKHNIHHKNDILILNQDFESNSVKEHFQNAEKLNYMFYFEESLLEYEKITKKVSESNLLLYLINKRMEEIGFNLRQEEKYKKDSNAIISNYMNKSNDAYSKKDYATSKKYLKLSLEISKCENNTSSTSICLLKLSDLLSVEGEYIEARNLLMEVKELSKDNKRALEVINSKIEKIEPFYYNKMAMESVQKKDFIKSKEYFEKSISCKSEPQVKYQMTYNYSLTLSQLKEHEKSNEYFEKCLNLMESSNLDQSLKPTIYAVIGSNFRDLKRYEKAIQYFEKSLVNNPAPFQIFSNLGGLYLFHREYDKSFEYLSKAYPLSNQKDNTASSIIVNRLMAKDYKEARKYLSQSNLRDNKIYQMMIDELETNPNPELHDLYTQVEWEMIFNPLYDKIASKYDKMMKVVINPNLKEEINQLKLNLKK